jgi:hypothetical protein
VRLGICRWPLAAVLLVSVGLCLTEARAQADKPLPPALPEVQEKTPAPSTPDAASDSGAPLSEELERSEGVIAPANPGVDPGMVKQPPDTGATATMPVIPPPGTPGGNPNVRPQ